MTNKQKQHLLAFLGFDPGPIDGVMGSQSREATRAFQQSTGLDPDGIFGEMTEAKILKTVGNWTPPQEAQKDSGGDFWPDIKHFTRPEFRCHCGKCGGFPAEMSEKLIRLADMVREHFNAPAHVSSGVRCREHNAELPGSVPNSRHLSGKAMDFRIEGIPASLVLPYVQSLTGVNYAYAIDSAYVHMDVR